VGTGGRSCTGLASRALFEARLDGMDLDELSLEGKPNSDMFLRCTEGLGAGFRRRITFL
jgi:hypothetical protein